MDTRRYTPSQIFCGLREEWFNATGSDQPIELDTQVYAHMRADGAWEELDLAVVFWRLEQFFGFECTRDEWFDLFRFDIAERDFQEWEKEFAPHLTFGVLAKFIADRAPVLTSFDPMPVFGRDCAAAGAFIGVERVANNVKHISQAIAPSTRIFDVLRGRDLERFWTKLRWMTENSIEALPAWWREAVTLTAVFGVLAVIASFLVTLATSNPLFVIAAVIEAAVTFLVACLFKQFANPLPPQIVTFRDLSISIAESRDSTRNL
jgi:hypothetical protein